MYVHCTSYMSLHCPSFLLVAQILGSEVQSRKPMRQRSKQKADDKRGYWETRSSNLRLQISHESNIGKLWRIDSLWLSFIFKDEDTWTLTFIDIEGISTIPNAWSSVYADPHVASFQHAWERKDVGRFGRVMPESMEMLGVHELATNWGLNAYFRRNMIFHEMFLWHSWTLWGKRQLDFMCISKSLTLKTCFPFWQFFASLWFCDLVSVDDSIFCIMLIWHQ